MKDAINFRRGEEKLPATAGFKATCMSGKFRLKLNIFHLSFIFFFRNESESIHINYFRERTAETALNYGSLIV